VKRENTEGREGSEKQFGREENEGGNGEKEIGEREEKTAVCS